MMDKSQIKQQFESQGYFLAKDVFVPEETAVQSVDFERIVQQLQASGENVNARWEGKESMALGRVEDVVIHTHNVHRYSRVWLDAMLNENFLYYASAILGEDVVLHHSKLFQKPAEHGAPFPVHQDWSYFPTENDSMMAGVIHVSDATEDMGCFRVFPGSHRLGRLALSNGRGEDTSLDSYPLEEGVLIEAQAGDVLFFHYLTLHGSFPNRSNKTRKTVLVQMHAGDDRVEAGNDHVDEQLVLQGRSTRASRSAAARH